LAIARALISRPSLIILDEAVSALDVSIRAQILDLLAELSGSFDIAYLFISHDLSVVRSVTDRVLIMKDGIIVEQGDTEAVFRNPVHRYTKSLIDAVPELDATAFALAVSAPLQAEQVLRFGTGGSDGSYFPIGSLIAGQINKLFDGCCGSDRLLLLPQRSNGSVSNIKEISSDLLDLGLAQADIVSLAYQGIGQFDGDDLKDELRTIGTLFQESVHLVVGVHSGIDSVKDLVGKLVSVDELGSGTQFDVELILKASDISSDQVKPVYLKPTESMERMRRGYRSCYRLR